ncbi:hypothetical protein MVLG_04752 [Microbotryum lychnidis-dioicae p1A1 Lamole]|uniref:Glycylpeptide N-tetradecanoyltransferase n=1 Tax=Microbotryum lychnidis-dioicae (strain p1A1 Lamole / MvSl-1064) TaxID=683840 RepID=U5HC65_USTV1|nr:hypothetical protein MVLG_04752 [Microbotryum lychnidis-dioicae p1A1 Lamole]|eukprot:KDE04788.1 hypothetical protein MVLG_04752 [Microbotryum lychnidis-dioicae p1A1 Lamole]
MRKHSFLTPPSYLGVIMAFTDVPRTSEHSTSADPTSSATASTSSAPQAQDVAAEAAPPSTGNGATVDDEDGYDGQLPDFSGDEAASAPTTNAPKLLPPKPRGPPGARNKKSGSLASSAAALKKKLSPGNKATKTTASSGQASSSTSNTEGIKMTDNQLDAVMAKLALDQPELAGKLQRLDVQELINQAGINEKFLKGESGLMGKAVKDMASHKFWSTQPVPRLDESLQDVREGPLEPNTPIEQIPREPIKLHKDFVWSNVELNDSAQLKEVYDLMTNNYVEDPDASFRFDYSAEFFEWALKPPGYVPDWHVGIRVAATGKLVAFISGIPLDLRVRSVTKRCTEINFLCVHKKLRSKRLTPLLIQEVTRRTHLFGIFQAIYTAGAYLPTPVSRCQYYHRNLNPQKLVKTGFTSIPRNSTMARLINHYRVPTETKLVGLREMEKKDLKQVARLIRAYNARFDIAPAMANKEVEHMLLAGRGKDVDGKRVGQIVWTYVVEEPGTGKITDVFSFYSLPSTATKMTTRTLVNAAYLFYYATTACPSCADLGDGSTATAVTNWKDETQEERETLQKRLIELISDCLILTSKLGFDVLNALTLQDNSLFLEDLKFGKGDGFLHYYLYNYATKPILGGIDATDGGSGVGVIML